MPGHKILFFVSGSYVGGLEMMTFQLMKELKNNGYDICCIINKWNDSVFKNMLSKSGINFYELKLGWIHLRKPLWTLDTLIHLPKAYLKTKKILIDYNPDIIHFHNFSNFILLYPLIKKRSIYTLHETHLPSKKNKFIYNLLNKKINFFVGVSEFISNCLRQLSIDGKKIKTIYNGIELNEGVDITKQKNNLFTIGIIGHINHNKGHQVLIDSALILANKNYSFKIKIFGNTNNEHVQYLKEIITSKNLNNYFEWMGFVSEKKNIYSQLNIVVVPTLCEEALSLTKMEAMYYKCPVIVTNLGGNPELVRNEIDGFIIKSSDAMQLAEKIEYFINNNGRLKEMGESAHSNISQYSIEKMTEKYISLYKKMLQN